MNRNIFESAKSLVTGMHVTLRNFLRRPVTEQYPWERPGLFNGSTQGQLRVHDFFTEETINWRSWFFTKTHESAPCTMNCPAYTPARDYVTCAGEGRYEEGIRLLKETYPWSATLGRVCNAPCEDACNRGIFHHNSIAIRQLKRFLSDMDRATPEDRRVPLMPKREPPTGKRVAIIGAGPAGLMAAVELYRWGHETVCFDRFPVAGGYLYTGIPSYRLPRDVLAWEISEIEKIGVEIRLNEPIDRERFEDLHREYDAVLIAVGATRPLRLNVPGENFEGVFPGEDFLEDYNFGRALPDFRGKRVVVIGGGNTAMDCCRVSTRLGAEVHVLYRRTKNEMSASIHEVEEATEEGVVFEYLVSPLEVIGEGGKVTSLRMVRNSLGERDASGRRRPLAIQGSEYMHRCDIVLTAISRVPKVEFLPKDIRIDRRGNVAVDWDTGAASRKGVFAAGDCALGAAALIEAIAFGKRAAYGIHHYLTGEVRTFAPSHRPILPGA
jgi:NADPH-dependent glutamate synthase beta subunit-like oxidoreductase